VSRFQELGLWRLFRSFRVLLAGYCLGFGTTKAERGARLFGVWYFGRHWLREQATAVTYVECDDTFDLRPLTFRL